MFETIARDLLLERNDHTVELYEGSGSNWRLVKTGSPGNIESFEDVLFANNEMQDTPVVVSIFPNFQEGRCIIEMAYVDLTRRILGLAEFFYDSDFTNLESSLIALGAKECIFPAASGKSNECKSLYDSLPLAITPFLLSHLFFIVPEKSLQILNSTNFISQMRLNQSFVLQISRLCNPSPKVHTFPSLQIHMHHSDNRRGAAFGESPTQIADDCSSRRASAVSRKQRTRVIGRRRESA